MTGDTHIIEVPVRRSLIALTALLLSIISPVSHATPLEDSYIAARDRYIAKFEKYDEDKKKTQLDERFNKGDPAAKAEVNRISKEYEQALADLQAQLQRIVKPPPIKGFSKPARINLDSLSQGYVGFGMVDGLVFDESTKAGLFVTTEGLLLRWIKENKDVPQDVATALISESLQSSLFFTDASISKFIEIPVVRPNGAKIAVAVAIRRTQDPIGERAPESIVVSVVLPPRVFVVSAPVQVKAEIPICNKIWKELEDHRAGAENIDKLEDDALKAFHRCYAAHARGQSFFPALMKQAQALADLLSAGTL